MNGTIKEILKYLATIFGIIGAIALSIVFVIWLVTLEDGKVYETDDIADYLTITGNYDNDRPESFIRSFFPAEIKASFSDVKYHYKAKKFDTYAYEAYLEFVIEDKAEYETFVSSVLKKEESRCFAYDTSFFEYTVSHTYEIWEALYEGETEGDLVLETAEVGKILYSDKEQRLIFVAIGMFDGGGAHAEEFDRFLNRFDISPKEFATSYREELMEAA